MFLQHFHSGTHCILIISSHTPYLPCSTPILANHALPFPNKPVSVVKKLSSYIETIWPTKQKILSGFLWKISTSLYAAALGEAEVP